MKNKAVIGLVVVLLLAFILIFVAYKYIRSTIAAKDNLPASGSPIGREVFANYTPTKIFNLDNTLYKEINEGESAGVVVADGTKEKSMGYWTVTYDFQDKYVIKSFVNFK